MGQKVGKYEIREVLGRGGMGVVYLAEDPGIGRTVALKVMPPADAQSAELRERFLREARAAGRLQHPNIVVIHDLGEEAGSLYIAMEYLEGRTLAERIATPNGRPDVGDVLELLAQVARGLHYAHERGVVHRDIKPANILVTNDGVAKILDFGIARAGDQRMTKTGQVMGTVYYMSPEQINGAQLDGRSDVFSAGVVLYELLTGDVPFEAESTGATMMRILTAPTPSLSARMPLFPPVLDEIVARALAKKPEERYASAAEFAKALEGAKKLCEAQRPAPAATAPTAPARAMAATVAPTVLHGASPFAPTTDPVFLSDMAEAAVAARGGGVAPAVAPAPVVSPSGAQTRPAPPDQPWRWWHFFWPTGESITGAKVGCRFSAGAALLVAALCLLFFAVSLSQDGPNDARAGLVFGCALVAYAFCGAFLLRYSRIAAVVTAFLAVMFGSVDFLLNPANANPRPAMIVSSTLLVLSLPGLRGAFLYHRLRNRAGVAPAQPSFRRWAIVAVVFSALIGAVVGIFLTRRDSNATSANTAAVPAQPAAPVPDGTVEVFGLITYVNGVGEETTARIDLGSDQGVTLQSTGEVFARFRQGETEDQSQYGLIKPIGVGADWMGFKLKFVDLKAKARKGDVVALRLKVPERPRSLLWDLARNRIRLLSHDKKVYFNDLRDLWSNESEERDRATIDRMVGDVMAGTDLYPKWLTDSVVASGRYQSQTTRAAVRKVTPEEMKRFLAFVNHFPGKYIGQDWKLIEVYATWITNGAPD